MEELLISLVEFALRKRCSDIHFTCMDDILHIEFRTPFGLEKIYQDIWKPSFFAYLKFKANLDLTNPYAPQSGGFITKDIPCRFSVIINQTIETGVLRILSTNPSLMIDELCMDQTVLSIFHSFVHLRQGLIIFSGPTNSGKTTTVHAILSAISRQSRNKIVSLEDPIEIRDDGYLQLQIDETLGFTYEKGIEELLRHDPDVIFIGECRNSYTAHMVIRACLTGHLVFTTIHAKDSLETLQRLYDFGIHRHELENTLTAIVAQRLYSNLDGIRKECVYEILTQKELGYAIKFNRYPDEFIGLAYKISEEIRLHRIRDEQAEYDIQSFKK